MLKLLSFVRPFVSLLPGGGLITSAASVTSSLAAFFSTPVGKWVAVALLGAGLYLFGDIHRGRLDEARYAAKWEAAVRQADAARALRDEAIRRAVSVDADQRIAAIQRESEQLQTKVAEYERALSASNAVACRVSPDDARRLRDLGYASAPGQGRGAGGVRAYLTRGFAPSGQGR
jgi:hypothetical protein